MSNAPTFRPKLLMISKGGAYGTNTNPTGANALRCFDTSVVAMQAEVLPVPQDDGEAGTINPPVLAEYASTLTTSTHLYGSGTAGVAPPQDLLYRACGFNLTTVTGVSCTYAPASLSSSLEWLDWYLNSNGQKRTAAGARGTFTMTLESGQLGRNEWNLMGLYAEPTNVSMPTPTYTGAINPQPVNAANTGTVTLNGVATELSSFTYTQNNTYALHDKASSAKTVRITESNPEASVVIMRPPLSVLNPYQMAKERTVFPLVVTHGTVAGNIITPTLPKVTITGVEDTEVGGLSAYTLTLSVQKDAGGTNYISIAYT
jgi:hypothetical protein